MEMKKGFTLMEIIIVLALIGILSTLGLSSFLAAQRQGRDTRRINDLKTIQNAEEQYFTANSQYPDACNPGAQYFPQGFPKDPITQAAYAAISCSPTGNNYGYCFCMKMENTTTGGNSTAADCNSFGSGAYFCVKNLQ
jgi:general secretion pathway protein G